MTNAEILQAQIVGDFFTRLAKVFETDSDRELNRKLWDAQEEQNGKNIEAIKKEMNRREREQ